MNRPNYVQYEGRVEKITDGKLWVMKDDDVKRLAEIINHRIEIEKYGDQFGEEEPFTDLACIGSGAVSQAVKAIAVARELVGPDGFDLVVVPSFSTIIDSGDEERTRILLRVFRVPAT